MPKDARYKAVKSHIEAGGVKTLEDLFLYIPKKTVYVDMGMNYVRFNKLVSEPDLFSIRELKRMAALFEVDVQAMIDLTLAQIEKKPKARKSAKG